MKRHTTRDEDQQFGIEFQETMVDYVAEHFTIDEVFSDKDQRQFVQEKASEWFAPGDLFDVEVLAEWAAINGFTVTNE